MGIIYQDVKRHLSTSFEDYLSIEGYSHSSLKQIKDGIKQEFIPSDKVKIGKIVDSIRMGEKANLSDPLYPMAKDIAERIRVELGDSTIKMLSSQISYIGNMIDAETGLSMIIKGRPDWELGKLAVIDLKVTFHPGKKKEDFIPLINYMGYDNQLWNYGKLGNKKSHYLVMYSVKARQTFFFKRLEDDISRLGAENWWTDKILEYGTV